MGEIAQGMIANSQKYNHMMQVRIENAHGMDQVTHEPTGYSEGARVIKEEETEEDQERERGIQKGESGTYESRDVRDTDGEKRRSIDAIMYDSEEHWRSGLLRGNGQLGKSLKEYD